MDDREELELLQERARSLEKSIEDIDYEIDRVLHDAAKGDDPGRAILFLQERHNVQLGFTYDLGKIDAKIDDFKNRVHEQENSEREQTVEASFQQDLPIAQEDYLDWLRPKLESPEEHKPGLDERHPQAQREDREPDDNLDWWKR